MNEKIGYTNSEAQIAYCTNCVKLVEARERERILTIIKEACTYIDPVCLKALLDEKL